MKLSSLFRRRWLSAALLGTAAALFSAAPVSAQGMGGQGGGQRGTGTGSGFGTGATTGTGTGTQGSTPLSQAGTAGTGGTAQASPASTDSFYNWYTNPLAPGLGSTRKIAGGNFSSSAGQSGGVGSSSGNGFSTTFTSGSGVIETAKTGSLNSPLFAAARSATATGPGAGTAGVGGLGAQTGTGFTSFGQRRAPQYTTEIDFKPAVKPELVTVMPRLRQMLDGSSVLPSGRTIRLAVNGQEVVLQGTVASQRERRVAENMIRMTPGVRTVRNELVATGP